VTVVDADVLLYAVNSSSPHHRAARRWLEQALNGDEPVHLTWLALLAFLRIATMPSFSARPLALAEALEVIDDWLAAPAALIAHPTANHASVLTKLLSEVGTTGERANDAHLAAIALEHGTGVCTFDRGIARFAGLKVTRPG
jgi:toxin-antitoxin system PIN domain toxin